MAWKRFLIRFFLICSFIVICLLVTSQSEGSHFDKPVYARSTLSTPNVVIILIDDLDLSLAKRLYQNQYLPNIKTYLAHAGVYFRNSFVTTAVCCPSRATMLTGQYSHNHGVVGNNAATGITQFDDTSTLATWVQDGGYFTGLVGKYLNEYGTDSSAPTGSPLNPHYVPPGYDEWHGLITPYKFYNYKLNENGLVVTYGDTEPEYQTDVLAGLAVDFFNQAEQVDEQPFFLIVAPVAPHVENGEGAPVIPGCTHNVWSSTLRAAPRHSNSLSILSLPEPPSFNEQDVSDKPAILFNSYPEMTVDDIICAGKQYQARAESMLAIDDLVGTIFSALAANNELNDTVVIFTSDNGFYHGEHRIFQKVAPYEEGIRVPFIVRMPGMTSGKSVDQYVLNNDIAPTVADFAGVTPGRAMDGRSLRPILEDPTYNGPWRTRFLVEFQGQLIQHSFPHFTAIRTAPEDAGDANRFYVTWEDGSVEYYNLWSDPDQLDSQHNNWFTRQERERLANALVDLQVCGGGTCQILEENN